MNHKLLRPTEAIVRIEDRIKLDNPIFEFSTFFGIYDIAREHHFGHHWLKWAVAAELAESYPNFIVFQIFKYNVDPDA